MPSSESVKNRVQGKIVVVFCPTADFDCYKSWAVDVA